MTLEQKLRLVTVELFKYIPPESRFTKIVKLWDDDTDYVEAKHGAEDENGNLIIHSAVYYNNKLTYETRRGDISHVVEDANGKDHYIFMSDIYDVIMLNVQELKSKKEDLEKDNDPNAGYLLNLIQNLEDDNNTEEEFGISFGKYSFDILDTVTFLNKHNISWKRG